MTNATVASETVTAAMPGWSGTDFLAFHMEMKRLGQTVCRRDAPDCLRCPLAAHCRGSMPLSTGWRRTGWSG